MKDGMRREQEDVLERELSSLYRQKTPEGFETAWRAAIRREENIPMKPKMRTTFWKAALPLAAVLTLVVGTFITENLELAKEAPSLKVNQSGTVQGRAKTGVTLAANEVQWDAWSFDEEAVQEAPMAEMAMYGGGAQTGGGISVARQQEVKIIRTANLNLATITFEQAESALREQTTNAGGYVEAVSQYGDGTPEHLRSLILTLRIPSEKLDAFLTGASGIGRVTSRSESAVDMTVQYSDSALRLATQKGKMERLQALLLKAETVSDLLEIETEISNTQYMLDSLETSLRGIDRQVEHSAVTVILSEESPADSAAAEGVSLGQRISGAFAASLQRTARFFQNMLVFLVLAAPMIALLVVAGGLMWLVRRRKSHSISRED